MALYFPREVSLEIKGGGNMGNIKDSERKKAYHPRGPHREGCMCTVCVRKRGKGEVKAPPPVESEIIASPSPPAEVRLDSLRVAAKFELGGQEYRVKERVDDVVACYNLAINESATLGGSTKVKPI